MNRARIDVGVFWIILGLGSAGCTTGSDHQEGSGSGGETSDGGSTTGSSTLPHNSTTDPGTGTHADGTTGMSGTTSEGGTTGGGSTSSEGTTSAGTTTSIETSETTVSEETAAETSTTPEDDFPAGAPFPTGTVVFGEHIAYVKYADASRPLFVARVDGTQERELVAPGDGDGDVSSPRWSPDGLRIAYLARPDSATPWGIHVIDADGRNAREIVAPNNSITSTGMSWFPDNRNLVYGVNAGGHGDIHRVDTHSGETYPLITTPANESEPAFSPDGRYIAYRRDLEVWIASADGSDPQPLVTDLEQVYTPAPAWSPDAETLYFTQGDYESNVYRIRVDGTELMQVTSSQGGESSISVHPSGAVLAVYHYESDGDAQRYGISTVDPSTGQLQDLIDDARDPSYQP